MTSDDRQKRISELRARQRLARESQEIQALLSAVGSLKFLGFASNVEQMVLPETVWKDIIRIDAAPSTRISLYASSSEMALWVTEGLRRIGDGDKYYLSFGKYSALPWIVIEAPTTYQWLPALWNALEPEEMIVLSSDLTSMFGITSEEDHYYGYVKDIRCTVSRR